MREGVLYNKAKAINLLSNENCICGSKLKFKDCCKLKGYRYSTLGRTFKKDQIIFNISIVDEIYDSISKTLINEIIDKELTLSQGKEMLKKLYKTCERGTREFIKYASCEKGCSDCCNLYLDCTAIEAELIKSFIKENFSTEKIMELENQIKDIIPKVPSYKEILKNEEDTAYNYIQHKQPCVFLSKDKSCSIYEVRPLNCRKLISFSDPQCCENNESITVPNISVNYITAYTINHLSMNISRFKKLKLYCEKMKEEKAIYKSLYHWFQNGFSDINREL